MDEIYPDEQILLNEVAKGDRKAFNLLYTSYADNVYHYIYLFTKSKEETEEILQEVFLNIWEHKQKLPAISSFKHYLYRAAKNRVINNIRHNRIKDRVFSEIRQDKRNTPVPPDYEVTYKEYFRLIQEAVERLPPKRKEIFRMHIEEGVSYAEIAEQLKICVSVVKKQYYKASHFVREYLYAKGEILPILFVLPVYIIPC